MLSFRLQRGATILEFVLVAPIVLGTFLFLTQLALLFTARVSVVAAMQECLDAQSKSFKIMKTPWQLSSSDYAEYTSLRSNLNSCVLNESAYSKLFNGILDIQDAYALDVSADGAGFASGSAGLKFMLLSPGTSAAFMTEKNAHASTTGNNFTLLHNSYACSASGIFKNSLGETLPDPHCPGSPITNGDKMAKLLLQYPVELVASFSVSLPWFQDFTEEARVATYVRVDSHLEDIVITEEPEEDLCPVSSGNSHQCPYYSQTFTPGSYRHYCAPGSGSSTGKITAGIRHWEKKIQDYYAAQGVEAKRCDLSTTSGSGECHYEIAYGDDSGACFYTDQAGDPPEYQWYFCIAWIC